MAKSQKVDLVSLGSGLLQSYDHNTEINKLCASQKSFEVDVDSLRSLYYETAMSQLCGTPEQNEDDASQTASCSSSGDYSLKENIDKLTKGILGFGAMMKMLESRVSALENNLTYHNSGTLTSANKLRSQIIRWRLPSLKDVMYPLNGVTFNTKYSGDETTMFNTDINIIDIFFHVRRDVLSRFKGTREMTLWTWFFKVFIAAHLKHNLSILQVSLANRARSGKYISPDRKDQCFLYHMIDVLARLLDPQNTPKHSNARSIILSTMQTAVMDVHRERSEESNAIVCDMAEKIKSYPPYEEDFQPFEPDLYTDAVQFLPIELKGETRGPRISCYEYFDELTSTPVTNRSILDHDL